MTCNDCNKRRGLLGGAIKLAQSELGIRLAPPEKVKERRAICEACDQWDHGRCRSCGCFTYAKTRLSSEGCPISKW